MAKVTNQELRNYTFYQVYNRNHNASGTFVELIEDLDRIKKLGTDVLYLLPIHPIGKKDKKGKLGCPYSIQNYREVNAEYGTLEDFQKLIEATHAHGMKIMMDVVYNHTSRDSHLLQTHPEWFYKNEAGEFANRVGDWSDITDFDFTTSNVLWDELIDTLVYWASMGVDGFRCDVAPLVPLDFWLKAREAVARVNKDFIWLAESIEPEFIEGIRRAGFDALSDCETFEAFDICYDYDVYGAYRDYLKGKGDLKSYVHLLQQQEYIYPKNYVKLRNLENHDQVRIASLVSTNEELFMWTAFNFFQRGAAMIYAGQEAMDANLPSLFDVDKVNWSRYNANGLADYIKELVWLKKDAIMAHSNYRIELSKDVADVVILTHEDKHTKRVGIFNFGVRPGVVSVNALDGEYKHLIDDTLVTVKDNKVALSSRAILFDITK